MIKLPIYNKIERVRISRSAFEYIKANQYVIENFNSDVASCGEADIKSALQRRHSYRNVLTQLGPREERWLYDLLVSDSAYRPFAVPGALKAVQIFIFSEDGYHQTIPFHDLCIGPENVRQHTFESFNQYVRKEYLERIEVQGKKGTFFIIAINRTLIQAKYKEISTSLIYMLAGHVSATIELLSAAKGFKSVVLFGAYNPSYFSLTDSEAWEITAAVRVGQCVQR
jgi:hypothetical protein